MHHALVLSIFSSTFLVLTTLSGTTGDPGPQAPKSLSDDSSLRAPPQQESALFPGDPEDNRISWRDLQNGWGKRGWGDLQGTGWGKRSWGDLRNGWGKRFPQDRLQNPGGKRAWSDLKGGSWGKRDWKQFRGGWGKRSKDDDEMPKLYDELENTEYEERNIDDDQFEEKRGWNNMKGTWGKRDWSSFRGAWGKRDPAWNNLKGLWGKRNDLSKRASQGTWTNMSGSWGK